MELTLDAEAAADEFDFEMTFTSSNEAGSETYLGETSTCAVSCGGTCSSATCINC